MSAPEKGYLAPMASAFSFLSATLLVSEENQAVVERNALRAEGIRQIRILTSGAEAARFLASQVRRNLPPMTDLLLCHPTLADMDAAAFARLVRSHPLLAYVPLLAVITSPDQKREATLRASGFNAVLARPFTHDDLHQHLLSLGRAEEAMRGQLLKLLQTQKGLSQEQLQGVRAFQEALGTATAARPGDLSGEAAYRQGIFMLREGKFDEALAHLQQAAKEDALHGEACLGMAAAWRRKGDQGHYLAMLQEALQAFLLNQAWGKAHAVCQRLKQEDPAAPCPLARDLERAAAQNKPARAVDLLGVLADLYPREELTAPLLSGLERLNGAEATAFAAALAPHDPALAAALVAALQKKAAPAPAPKAAPSALSRWLRGRKKTKAAPEPAAPLTLSAPKTERSEAPAPSGQMDFYLPPPPPVPEHHENQGEPFTGEDAFVVKPFCNDAPELSEGGSDVLEVMKGTFRMFRRKKKSAL